MGPSKNLRLFHRSPGVPLCSRSLLEPGWPSGPGQKKLSKSFRVFFQKVNLEMGKKVARDFNPDRRAPLIGWAHDRGPITAQSAQITTSYDLNPKSLTRNRTIFRI